MKSFMKCAPRQGYSDDEVKEDETQDLKSLGEKAKCMHAFDG